MKKVHPTNPNKATSLPTIRYIPSDVSEVVTPSFRFFGAKIKNHPENPPEEAREAYTEVVIEVNEDDNNDQEEPEPPLFIEPTQVLFKGGRVTALAVDPDFLEIVKKQEIGRKNLCNFCRDEVFVISPELKYDLKLQGCLVFKILMIENFLHLFTLTLVVLQYFVRPFHDFVYEQWAVIFLFTIISYVTLVWSIFFSDISSHNPADSVLLAIKAVSQGVVGVTVTGMFERLVVMWVVQSQDFPDPGSLPILYKAKNIPHWKYTYPFIVPIFLIDVSIVHLITSLFLVYGGSVRKDTMLWLAFLLQFGLSSLQLYLGTSKLLHGKIFFGPPEWNMVQLILSALTAFGWEQWRLYNIRLLLTGKINDINLTSFKRGALDFCI